ncbi:MAG: PEGA domain-containing protein [Myxococcota bacterium]
MSALTFGICGVSGAFAEGDLRIDGLGGRAPERILVFVVRSEGVTVPVASFQETARRTIEEHMHARVVSMEEAFVRGGESLQQRLAECKGADGCYARLAGSVEVQYLLVITASHVGELDVVGARLLDLGMVTPVGNAVDPVTPDTDLLQVVPERIRAAVPPAMWDPFGGLLVKVDQDGAEVSINSKVAGVTPLDRIGYLLPGNYKVSAVKAGFRRTEADVVVDRGSDAQVGIHLLEEDSGGLAWWVWGLIGVAVLGGVATGVAVAASSGGTPTFCTVPDTSTCPK